MSEKETYKLQIGPNHPALKEPVKFDFEIEGEHIVYADIDMGYTHRGIEHVARERNFIQLIYLLERVCGICSTAHPMAYCLSIENAVEMEVPTRAKYIRAIVGELERLNSHLLWAGVAAHEIGFDTLFYTTWDIREKVMDCLEAITGNRVNYAMVTMGGVRRDLEKEQIDALKKALEYYRELYYQLEDILLNDMSVRLRMEGVGILTKEEAMELCAVGPTARASGVERDIRVDYPLGAYPDIPWLKPVSPLDIGKEPIGDVYDRLAVHVLEVKQSVEIVEFCIENLPEGKIMVEPKAVKMINQLKKVSAHGVGRYEAPRGEVFHYCIMDNREGPALMKVKAPTYSNIIAWIPMFRGAEIADIPIIMASIDPCIACADRATFLKEGKRKEISFEELRKMSRKKWDKIRGGSKGRPKEEPHV